MRIAYLCKRRYMGKDVILDRYARLYEIPYQLARLGHTVQAYCFAYRRSDADGAWSQAVENGQLAWKSQSLGLAAMAYPRALLSQLRAFDPDVVIAASDIPHVVLGGWLSRRLHRPFIADLYDNFEGFGQARIPGAVPALRKAVCDADLVVTTSEPLRKLVVDGYRARGDVVAMPSAVDKSIFHPRDKAACRRELGLPSDASLIGTAGGLYRSKGIGDLYRAWSIIESTSPEVHLVLAGPPEPNVPMPQGARVHYLGAMPHERVATLFGALDAGAICILDTAFGRYCFPQKAYEMLSCDLPVVAADVGAMGALFDGNPGCLYRSGDATELAARLLGQLGRPVIPPLPIDDWEAIVGKLASHLSDIVRG
jgi:glycosyltransferase involved in cell wall biosynthesis